MIAPNVRAKLEEAGVDCVRSKAGHYALDNKTSTEPLGDGIKATTAEMREWLAEKDAKAALWVKVGVWAAIIAAVASIISIFVTIVTSH
jgi:hypothetical protein